MHISLFVECATMIEGFVGEIQNDLTGFENNGYDLVSDVVNECLVMPC